MSGAAAWLVFYGNPGDQAEAAFSLSAKPSDLGPEAIWDEANHEAVFRFQFGSQDQIIPVGDGISLLAVSRDRAYRAKELSLAGNRALIVSGSDDATLDAAEHDVTLHLELRQSVGEFTVVANQKVASAKQGDSSLPIKQLSGLQEFTANIPVPSL